MGRPLSFALHPVPVALEVLAASRAEHVARQEIAALSLALPLTALDCRYVWTLAQGGWFSADALIATWHSDTGSVRSAHVIISRLRKRLAPRGMHIETEYALGYRLSPPSLQLIRDIMAKGREEAAR